MIEVPGLLAASDACDGLSTGPARRLVPSTCAQPLAMSLEHRTVLAYPPMPDQCRVTGGPVDTRHGAPEPERSEQVPTGSIDLRAPPQLPSSEGAGGVLLNTIPMLGSLGSVVLVATMGNPTRGGQTRSLLAAAFFLAATLGFLLVQLDRQRTQRIHTVIRARNEYLRHLGTVRESAREAAAQQRRALLRQHPGPSALPALAAEGSRVWERGVEDAAFLRVRYGVGRQPLSVKLREPDADSVDQVDPASASALRRLLAVHRVQRDLPWASTYGATTGSRSAVPQKRHGRSRGR